MYETNVSFQTGNQVISAATDDTETSHTSLVSSISVQNKSYYNCNRYHWDEPNDKLQHANTTSVCETNLFE
jgi:hypothetical protein